MRLILADNVHGVLVDEDFVLLDTTADTYFCLPAGGYSLEVLGRELTVDPPRLADELCKVGIAHPVDPHASAADGPAPIPRPQRTARAALDSDPALKATRTRGRHVAALASAVQAALAAKKRTFANRLAPSGRPPSPLSRTLLADLAVYRRLAPWLPLDGRCFFRSDMLRAYLRTLGHEVRFVFGVRTWPFRAHCWLQVEDVALDDEAERLAAYHPILAV